MVFSLCERLSHLPYSPVRCGSSFLSGIRQTIGSGRTEQSRPLWHSGSRLAPYRAYLTKSITARALSLWPWSDW